MVYGFIPSDCLMVNCGGSLDAIVPKQEGPLWKEGMVSHRSIERSINRSIDRSGLALPSKKAQRRFSKHCDLKPHRKQE